MTVLRAFAVAVVALSIRGPHAASTGSPPTARQTAGNTPSDDDGGGCGATLRPLVTATMTELGVPGAVVLVDAPGQCLWEASLGTPDVTKNASVSLADHFRVGSITKTFTGTAVLQLVDEGSVGLDDRVSKYLPDVPGGDAITVRELLQMTSGLYNYSEDTGFNASLDADPHRIWSIDELLAIAYAHPPYFSPGAAFHYSNTNSVLLGRIVETVTGNALRDELQRRIFDPLHMRDTTLPSLADASMPDPHPRGYMYGTNVGTLPGSCDAEHVGRHDVTDASPSWTWAAGGAISTVRDLATWARALATGRLLSAATQAERLRFIPTGPPPAPGYGLHITNFSGMIGHDGALPGFQSFVGYVPAKDAALVILTNVYPDVDCGGPADQLAKVIAGALGLISVPQEPEPVGH